MINRQTQQIYDIMNSKEKIILSALTPEQKTEAIKKRFGLNQGASKKTKKKRRKK